MAKFRKRTRSAGDTLANQSRSFEIHNMYWSKVERISHKSAYVRGPWGVVNDTFIDLPDNSDKISNYEEIDMIGLQSSGRFKYCSRTVNSCRVFPGEPSTLSTSRRPYWVRYQFPGYPLSYYNHYYNDPVAYLRSQYGIDYRGYTPTVSSAYAAISELQSDEKLLGQGQLNLLSSVIELIDIRRLFDTISTTWFFDSKWSDKALTLEFGYMPLVSDIKKIYKSLYSLDKSIKKWNQAVSSGETLNAHSNFFYKEIDKEWTVKSSDKYYHVHNTAKGEVYGKAHVYYRPVSKIQGVGKLIARAKSLGLHKPQVAAWNAIAFSFIADWFSNVGNLLENLSQMSPTVKYELVSAGWSYREHYDIVSYNEYVYGSKRFPCGTIYFNYDRYKRYPLNVTSVVPDFHYGSLKFDSDISSNQAFLLTALIDQNFRK